MGTYRETVRKDGKRSYHAEVRLKGHPPQRGSFRTLTLAKKWIQDTESAIRDGRHAKTVEAKRHTVGEMVDRFIEQWLPKTPKSRLSKPRCLCGGKRRVAIFFCRSLPPRRSRNAGIICLVKQQ